MDRNRVSHASEHLDKSKAPVDRQRREAGIHQTRMDQTAARNEPGRMKRDELAEGSEMVKILIVLAVVCSLMLGLYLAFN